MGKKELTQQNVIKKWKELDRKSNKKFIGLKEVCKEMGIKPYNVIQLFQGESMTDVKRKHGIRLSPPETPYTYDQLLEKYHSVVHKKKKIPSWNMVRFDLGIPDSTFKKYFQKTNDIKRDLVEEYYKWLKKRKPNSHELKLVEKWLKGEDKQDISPAVAAKKSRTKTHVSRKTGGRTYGRPHGYYENLICEPSCEQEVVVLFAMMCKHLQYYILGVWENSFPDCEAMRIESGGNLRRVMIEFQYKSKDFVSDGHNPNGCDVIVCWKDNWKDCPKNIEVLELSKEVEKIQSTKK
jgi:hypothetical protein